MKRYARVPKAIQTHEGFRVTTYLLHLRLAGTEGTVVLPKLRTLEFLIDPSLVYMLDFVWKSHLVAGNWGLEPLHNTA